MPIEKTIGIDLRMWEHPGIGRYIRELTGAMLRFENPERFRFLAYERDHKDILLHLGSARLDRAFSPIYSLSEQAELFGFSNRVDLLHVPHFNAPLFCRSKLIVTVHDLIYLKSDLQSLAGNGQSRSMQSLQRFYVRTLLGGVCRNATDVIVVSDFTRRDLELFYPGCAGRTRVIREAASGTFRAHGDAEAAKKQFGLGPEYLLFVGSLKAHKNLAVLLDAFATLRRDHEQAQLVVVGKRDRKEQAIFDRVSTEPGVKYLGVRADDELAQLYRGAKALVLPSLWEGFGLTALEAMACGTPVISSDRASLPEVVGDAALLFNPEDTQRLAELMQLILTDREMHNSLSRKGLQRSKEFSWENTAHETLKLYEKALSS